MIYKRTQVTNTQLLIVEYVDTGSGIISTIIISRVLTLSDINDAMLFGSHGFGK